MERCKIYLSGAMSGLTLEDALKWRNNFSDELKYGDYSYEKKPIIFNPPLFYNYENLNYSTEKEIMEFELNELRKSDVVVVNLETPFSIGTSMELILAKEYRIPVVGFNIKNDIHPWIRECVTKECYSMKDAVKYLVEYFLW